MLVYWHLYTSIYAFKFPKKYQTFPTSHPSNRPATARVFLKVKLQFIVFFCSGISQTMFGFVRKVATALLEKYFSGGASRENR